MSVDGFLAQDGVDDTIDEEYEDEAASWLLINPVKNSNSQTNGLLFGGDVDGFLFGWPSSFSVLDFFGD
jgi:hypothetical protein